MQKQINYLQHSQPNVMNNSEQKKHMKNRQRKQPEIEFIAGQLEEIKKQRDIIHKLIEDEVTTVQGTKDDDSESQSSSIHTEEDSCLDESSVIEHASSSIFFPDSGDSLNLSDIEFMKSSCG